MFSKVLARIESYLRMYFSFYFHIKVMQQARRWMVVRWMNENVLVERTWKKMKIKTAKKLWKSARSNQKKQKMYHFGIQNHTQQQKQQKKLFLYLFTNKTNLLTIRDIIFFYYYYLTLSLSDTKKNM